MQKKDVYAIPPKAGKAFLALLADLIRREEIGYVFMGRRRPLLAFGIDFGGDESFACGRAFLFALFNRLPYQLLNAAVAVSCGSVDVSDAQVQGGIYGLNGRGVVFFAPYVARHLPRSQAYFAKADAGATKLAVIHVTIAPRHRRGTAALLQLSCSGAGPFVLRRLLDRRDDWHRSSRALHLRACSSSKSGPVSGPALDRKSTRLN